MFYITVYHVLPHTMFYRKWNCFRWRDFLERERLRRTFIHRHLKFSNGTERLLPDDPNWTVDEGHNTPRGGGSSSRKTGSSRGKYNSYTHWWLNITKLVQNLCYRWWLYHSALLTMVFNSLYIIYIYIGYVPEKMMPCNTNNIYSDNKTPCSLG